MGAGIIDMASLKLALIGLMLAAATIAAPTQDHFEDAIVPEEGTRLMVNRGVEDESSTSNNNPSTTAAVEVFEDKPSTSIDCRKLHKRLRELRERIKKVRKKMRTQSKRIRKLRKKQKRCRKAAAEKEKKAASTSNDCRKLHKRIRKLRKKMRTQSKRIMELRKKRRIIFIFISRCK